MLNCQEPPIIILVGNKTDLESERCVPYESGLSTAQALGCEFFELSAKTQPEKLEELSTKIAELSQNELPKRKILCQVNHTESKGCC